MLKRNKLTWILMGVASLAVLTTVIAIPVSDYIDYQKYVSDYKEALEEEKYNLIGLSVEKNDDVTYFDNGKASPNKDDFKLSGLYSKVKDPSDSYKKRIKTDDFEMVVPEDFHTSGGNITFSFEGLTTELSLTLTPVIVDRIEVTELPFKMVYRPGEYFIKTGLEVSLVNNDGSSQLVDSTRLNITAPSALDYGEKTVTITYVDNGVNYYTALDLYVSEEPSLYEYTLECENESKDLEFAVTPIYSKIKQANYYLQGAATDGQYAYYALNTNGNVTGVVAKYDLENRKVVATSKEVALSGETTFTDNGNLFIYNKKVYFIKSDFTQYVFDLKTLELLDEEGLTFLEGPKTVSSVAYDPFMKRFAVSDGATLSIYDETNLTAPITSASVACSVAGYSFQTLYSTQDCIYALYGKNSTGDLYLEMYTWGGLSLGEKLIHADELAPSSTSNIQNILEIGKKIYVGVLDWNNGFYIYNITAKGNHYNSSPSLMNYLVGGGTNITGNSDANLLLERYKLDNTYCNIQSVCTDGVYQYYLFCNTANTKGKVARYNIESNSFDLTSKDLVLNNTVLYQDPNATLSYVKGDIILTAVVGGYYTLDKETLTLKSNSLFFPEFNGTLTAIEYHEKLGRYAVFNRTNYMYLYDDNFNLINTVSVPGFSSNVFQNSGSTKDYIYTYYSQDNSDSLPFTIMDWNGNVVSSKTVAKMGYSASNGRNIQTYCEYNGKGYVGTLTWTGGYGLYLYEVTWGK